MPINRESIITVLRSTGGNIPDGLTFGEFGFAGANRQLFIGGTGGNQAVQSIWIGASITGDDITNAGEWAGGTGAYRVSTSDAVKRYVDSKIAESGSVSSVNANTGAITITGAGNGAAVVVRTTGDNTHRIDARVATESVTGVAHFNVAYFSITPSGGVSLKQGTTFTVRGSDDSTDTIGLTGTLTLTGSGAIRINVNDGVGFNNNATVTFDPRMASGTLTGVASFDPRHFAIGLSGHVSLTGSIGADSVRIASATITGAASFDPRHFALGASGHVSLTGSYQVTGHTVVSAGVASSQVVSTSNNTTTIDNRIATDSLTGVASFDSSHFTVTNGKVVASFSGGVTFSGVPVFTRGLTAPGGIHTVGLTATNGRFTGNLTVDGNTTHTGTVTNTGTQTFNGGIQTTGLTSTGGLSASGLVYFTNGLTAPGGIHTTGLTATTAVFNGLATFSNGLTAPGGIHTVGLTASNGRFTGNLTVDGNTTHTGTVTNTGTQTFNGGIQTTGLTSTGGLSASGLVYFTNGLTAPGGIHTRGLTASNIVGTNASFSSGVTFTGTPVFSSGLSATGITANTIFANNATFTNATFTNDVTVTGNLTVDGTVITANVANIVIEDPLIKLGTGNNGDTYDLGFYGQYVGANTDKRFTGLFRDANDGGKYKLFTGLTGGVEPTTEVNPLAQGYTVATLIAKLDGGTF